MKFKLEQATEVLASTPPVLRSLLGDLSDPWIRRNYGEETFSPFDVVGHLIHGERTDWVPRARIILEKGEAEAFEPFDRFAMFQASKGKTLDELLDQFEELRELNLKQVQSMELDDAKLALTGTHPELGRVTLEQLLATWAVHDLGHIAQIARAMAYRYRDKVGPWKAYISILKQ